jgi:chromosome segregation ATPase
MKNLVITILLLTSAGVLAQDVYKWVDKNGEVHYSQTLPPERAGEAHDRLTRDGLVAERVDRVKTADELAELETQRDQERELADQERIQAQQDRLFLAAYPTREDVRRTIETRRETVMSERNSVESLVEQSRSRFVATVQQAAELERAGKPVPEYLVERIDEARAGIRELNRRLDEIDKRLASLDDELATELARHRRLTDSG